MNTDSTSTLAIAILSLVFSFWALVRSRRNREIDMLHQCYARLHQASANRPYMTITQHIEMEETPDDPRWEEYVEKSEDAQDAVERELEFACYLVIQKQINLEMFF